MPWGYSYKTRLVCRRSLGSAPNLDLEAIYGLNVSCVGRANYFMLNKESLGFNRSIYNIRYYEIFL